MDTFKDDSSTKEPTNELNRSYLRSDVFQMLQHSQMIKDQARSFYSTSQSIGVYELNKSVPPSVQEEARKDVQDSYYSSFNIPRPPLDSEEGMAVTKREEKLSIPQNVTLRTPSGESLHRERRRWARPPRGESLVKDFPMAMHEEGFEPIQSEAEDEGAQSIIKNKSVCAGESKVKTMGSQTSEEQSGFYKTMRNYIRNYNPLSDFGQREVVQREQDFAPCSTFKANIDVKSVQEFASYDNSPTGVRIPSPSSVSSVTSGRRLEWDSGADVGYQTNQPIQNELSTIERIALARGCSAALLVNIEKGKTSSVQVSEKLHHSVQHSAGIPIAESTRVEREGNIHAVTSIQNDVEITPILRQQFVQYCSSSDEYETEVKERVLRKYQQQNIATEQGEDYVSSEKSFNLLLKKYSSSLSDLSICDNQMENPGRSLQRSCSSLNLSDKDRKEKHTFENQPRTINGACSVSSSSVATIVPKQESPLVEVSHCPAKSSVAVQTSVHSASPELIEAVNTELLSDGSPRLTLCKDSQEDGNLLLHSQGEGDKVVQVLYESHKCTGAHRKGSCCAEHKTEVEDAWLRKVTTIESEQKKPDNVDLSGKIEVTESSHSGLDNKEQDFGTLDSVASSTQTAGSWFAAETSRSGTGARIGGVVDSANSFEYLPGYVYESNAVAPTSSVAQNPITVDSASESDVNRVHSQTPSNEASDKQWNSSSSSSLARDLEQGVQMLRNLVAGKSYNAKLKKALIRRVVDRLVESDYGGDSVPPSPRPNLNLEANVPWVPARQGPVPLEGLGSSRKKPAEELRVQNSRSHQADKCVGTVASEVTATSSSSCTVSGSVSLPGDSRAETTSDTSNAGCGSLERNWRNVTTRSEEVLEIQKHKQKQRPLASGRKTLVDFCQTERQNQLHWIRFEIDHLNNLKQLLEGQEGSKKSLISLASHKHSFHQVKPSSSVTASSEKSHKQSCGSSASSAKSSGNLSFPKPGSAESRQKTAVMPWQTDDVIWSSHNFLPPEPMKKETCTQIPSPNTFLSYRKQKENTVPSQHLAMTPTPTFDSSGSIVQQVDTAGSTLGSIINGNMKNGKINVYHQTLEQSVLPENVRESNVNLHKAESVSSEQENVPKKSIPMCCCECRRLLKDIVQNRTLGNIRTKISNICTQCQKSKSESARSTADSSVLSPDISGNSNDIASQDSKETFSGIKMISIGTETTETVAVQTTPSINKLPVIRPLWFSRNANIKEQASKVKGKGSDSGKMCPSCGLVLDAVTMHPTDDRKRCRCHLPSRKREQKYRRKKENLCLCCESCTQNKENETVTSSESSGGSIMEDSKGIKNTKEPSSLTKNKKEKHCPCCGRVEKNTGPMDSSSIVPVVNSSTGPVHNSTNSKMTSHPEPEKVDSESKEKEHQNVSVPEPTPVTKPKKEPLAYVLTFEPTKLENIMTENKKRRSLPEIKVKIPVLKHGLQNVKVVENEGSERVRSRSSSKENENPSSNESMQSAADNLLENKHSEKPKPPQLTLQEYLKANRPDYIMCADKRRQCMVDLAYLREMRHMRRQELLALSSEQESTRPTTSSSRQTQDKSSWHSRRIMHVQTRKLYQRTAEVKSKKAERKKKEDYRTNRLMAEIFTKKLQRKVLLGKVNISNSESVISTL
ncbi:uncharacterized protein [Anabrus simplex]|uniref:uncharacterized protein n=1 Tax=Anabrus simplex TaxID=316456 RepID=UPI0035A2E08E